MLDWNDMRTVLALARARSLAGAARALAVNPSTVFRRLNALEQELGTRLFDRLPAGYRPTPVGDAVVAAAERMEQEAIAADRLVTGRDTRLGGTLRITSSETTAFRLLPRHLAAFRRRHPGIVVELVIDNRMLSLSRREADVALRPTRPTEGDLFGRKLADMAWAVYASPAYLDAHGAPAAAAAMAGHAVIGWDDGAPPLKVVDWLRATVPAEAVVYRSNSLLNQMAAAAAGIGLAVLPCFLADPEPALARALPPQPDLARELWLVTHADLTGTARIRAFMEFMADAITGERALFEGRLGDPS